MQQQSIFFSLEQIIDRQPLTVAPITPLQEVIRLMHEWGNSCTFDASREDNSVDPNNSCVLVTQDNHLQGIFTERDLVKLVAKKTDTRNVTVGEMMVPEVVTLTLKEDTDIFTALSLLRKHRIRHLPIVDNLHNLIGLITAKSLRQKLQPINLMKWREASEVMSTDLVYTSPDDSVRNVAVLMAERDISCVAICELLPNTTDSQSDGATGNSLVRPVGIITERDIVQFQNLDIDLEQPARNLMSTPLFLVNPQDSLWNVYQQMRQRHVRRLLVADERGELAGIITQTSLLQIFDPAEMYGVIEVLQRQVCQLETEREKLLAARNEKLEREVEERTADILDKNQQLQRDQAKLRKSQTEYQQQLEFERLITKISARFLTVSAEQLGTEIRSALKTITEFIQIETSYIFRFADDYSTFSMTHEWSTSEADSQIKNAQNLPASLFPWAIALIKRGETVRVNSVSELPPEAATDRDNWQAFNLESLLIIPYQEAERIVGWLGFASFAQSIIWTPGTVNLLQVVGEIFASTLQRQQASLAVQASEQKFRAIFDQSFQFIGLLEPNGKIIEANRTALDFVGLTPEDVRGQLFWQTPWWSKSLAAQELLKQGIKRAAQGEFIRFEVEHPGTENRLVTVDFSLTPIKDATGKVVMLIPEGRNISDRKQAEADLAQSNHILQAISSIQTQYLTDAEPQILFDVMLANLLELTESEYGFISEIHFTADGSPKMEEGYMKVRGRPYLKTHGITNIAWNEETRAFYAENAPKGMEFHNLETLFGAVMVTGEPVIANSSSTDPGSGGVLEGHPTINTFLGVPFYKNNKMTGMVGIANRQDGYDETLVHYLRPFLDTCSRIIEAYKSDRQRQQAEAKIREQAALLNVATDAIMVRSLDGKVLFWNRGAEKLYGWTKAEALHKNATELLNRSSSIELSQIHQAVREQGEWQGELNQVTQAGQEIVVESRWTMVKDEGGNPLSYLVVNTDITEQKQLEAQFLRTQRLESLGTLAGGIAHDLNNILAPILGFSKLLPLKLPDLDEQTKGFFKIIENNANRGTALVKQILTFARGMEGEKGIVQIRHLITEIGQIIAETFPKSIELDINVPKNLWTVNADVNQLHQVLMNLAVNARDAMPDGGRLSINGENTTLDAKYARLHLDAREGSYVSITVSDTGVGIPPQIIDRIFEPFFTTKKVGHGTGLGLSTVIGIIKSHDGFVDVVSNKHSPTYSTQFKVFLPASDIAENNLEQPEEILHGNRELILVADDEPAILEVSKATLETYNYQVLTANNGIEAIALYAQHQPDIKAVIMDIMMPSMDGKIAIKTLRKINPAVQIIAVSGLIERQEIITELDGNVAAFLNKPYANEDLLHVLHEMISKEN